MEYTHTRRRLSTTLPPSTPLLRSRSTTPATATLPVNNNNYNHFCSPNSCHRFTCYWRSKGGKISDEFSVCVGFVAGEVSGVSGGPESPGQNLGCPARPESPGFGGKIRVKGGGVGGVLKYFKQRKVSPPLEEEFHRFRVLHNRLLQWRFVNARGEAAMAGVKRIAEAKLFSIWVRIFKMRKTIVEKKIQMQRLKLEIKSYQIISPQMFLLNEWSRLERRNQESVSRLARKLLGLSVRLPLVQGAKIETTLYLLTELRSMLEQEDEYLEELEIAVPLLRALLAKEESIQIHLIQAA
ncbi:QWRF motif-containing protein 7 [Juglans microcarpa x Juglans regia]|uniref:QWRF motif-containing protein 7 n=1 Tax=Juglans microcarpa x Juglans regia TaxID=2249226 RepID=UPI001B7E2FC2|nr:QWRF motif-containing protein 7 [Juglans microcarpa x Juglans regia]